MRRATTLALAGILVVAFGAYSAYWWVAAGKIKQGAADWAQTAARSAHRCVVAVARRWRIPILISPRPDRRRSRRHGSEPAGPAARAATLGQHLAVGFSRFLAERSRRDQHRGRAGCRATRQAGRRLRRCGGDDRRRWRRDDLAHPLSRRSLPPRCRFPSAWRPAGSACRRAPPATHTEPAIGVAAILHDLDVPAAPPGFGKTVDELGFGVTLMGALPAGPPREAAAAWRAAGGTVELDHFDLRWGAIGLTGSGTLALDADLQPEGSLSGAISGYDQLLNALVASGRMQGAATRASPSWRCRCWASPGQMGASKSRPRSRSRTARCSSARSSSARRRTSIGSNRPSRD